MKRVYCKHCGSTLEEADLAAMTMDDIREWVETHECVPLEEPPS